MGRGPSRRGKGLALASCKQEVELGHIRSPPLAPTPKPYHGPPSPSAVGLPSEINAHRGAPFVIVRQGPRAHWFNSSSISISVQPGHFPYRSHQRLLGSNLGHNKNMQLRLQKFVSMTKPYFRARCLPFAAEADFSQKPMRGGFREKARRVTVLLTAFLWYSTRESLREIFRPRKTPPCMTSPLFHFRSKRTARRCFEIDWSK